MFPSLRSLLLSEAQLKLSSIKLTSSSVVQKRIYLTKSGSQVKALEKNAHNDRSIAPSYLHKTYLTDNSDTKLPNVKTPAGYFRSLIQVWRSPAPALCTGLAGLIPFIAAPSYLYFYASSFQPFIISAQLAYGAVILSFVGGIRWGFVVPYKEGSTHLVTWKSIIQSTVPSMIAWGGLMVPDLTGGLLVVATGMCLALYNDLRLFGDYPKWMLGLRCLLTTVAVATLLISLVLVEENRMKKGLGSRTQNKLLDKEI